MSVSEKRTGVRRSRTKLSSNALPYWTKGQIVITFSNLADIKADFVRAIGNLFKTKIHNIERKA